jgi:D-methionine transport system substrate-binding protein
MNFKKVALLNVLCSAIVFLASCGSNTKESDPNHIKVGVQSGPEFVLAETAKRVAEEKFGLTVELVQFNDYVLPNEALHQGDLDANVFQNKPYLDVQAKQRGYNFAIVGNTFVYPLAGYSKKIKSIDELTDGNTILIPNDPTNGGRALLLMQHAGLITLKEDVGLLPTVNDIVSNPLNLKIMELEAPQLPRALDDKNVTIAIINNTFATPIGLIASRDGLFVEDKESPYVNLVVAREDNQHEEKIKKFVQAYQSEEVAAAAEREFKGSAIKGW